MAKCRTCGRVAAFWDLSIGRKCPECIYPEDTKSRIEKSQMLVNKLSESPAYCYVAFKDAVGQMIEESRAAIGDLFVTSGGIVFFPFWP